MPPVRSAKSQIASLERECEAMRRIGRALSMNQTLVPTAVQAAHAINGALDLTATAIWAVAPGTDHICIAGAVGLKPSGGIKLESVEPSANPKTLVEMALTAGQAIWTPDLQADYPQGEASACTAATGGAVAVPLLASGKAIGALLLVAHPGDDEFLRNVDLHLVIAEHLALAVSSANLFESVERMATVDPLTGIANHRAMQDFLHRAFGTADRDGSPVSAVMVDVDHFRRFNEEEGHDCGDEVLRIVAGCLASCMGPRDLAARYGGEEFTLVLPGCSGQEAAEVAERARLMVEQIQFTAKSGSNRSITASFGVSSWPEPCANQQDILKTADQALYTAKRSGRNLCVLYSPASARLAPDQISSLATGRSAVTAEEWAEGKSLWKAVRPFVNRLAGKTKLPAAELETAKLAVHLWPAWEQAVTTLDTVTISKLLTTPGLELASRALAQLDERADGQGRHHLAQSSIPRPALIVAAAMCHHASGLPGLLADPGRFGPEIMAAVVKQAQAA